MSNTYHDATGVLLFDGPAQVTPVIKMLFEPFNLDVEPDGDDGQRYVAVLSEETNCSWDTYAERLTESAERDFGIDFDDLPEPDEVLERIGTYFGLDLGPVVDPIDFDASVSITDILKLALLLIDGHNLTGLALEGAWHGDKPRLWEFGGWATLAMPRYTLDLSTSEVLRFAQSLNEALALGVEPAAQLLGGWVDRFIDGVVDESVRLALKQRLNSSALWNNAAEGSGLQSVPLVQDAAASTPPGSS